MIHNNNYLNPICSPRTLDTFAVRRAILEAIRSYSPYFKGIVLDIGCGHMPYQSVILGPPSRAELYIGMDVKSSKYSNPHVKWNGRDIPFRSSTVDCALATEVLEHCPEPQMLINEAFRILKPGGHFFFTVPFLWPLHDSPYDEYRYTPFALERLLRSAGFEQIELKALGGWDASLAQMLGLWLRRRQMAYAKRAVLSFLLMPVYRYLLNHDRPQSAFGESEMITGVFGRGFKSMEKGERAR